MEERKAMVVNDLHNEVLCYEFVGTLGKIRTKFSSMQIAEQKKSEENASC